ncbi:B3 domain-containing protein Os03g0212300 [Beta vulgaris subsp. vulgaris]|uniref:B3 domain-containing protein Os03g0212300 n=1 Tax=Beta vulgaris subsp. vulgaris TaxID=3555 RepID=UPI0020367DD8|nr:B3 domain-containing protein Os03g0212300 [Beta vulgaris subsp. vulgaris]
MRSSRLMKIQKTEAPTNCDPKIQFASEDNKPYFFKIIVSPFTQKLNLRIPVEFVKKYGRHLSDIIYLSVPNSEQPWKVQLERTDNNDMFLGKGWQDLMEFYNMMFGHFLLFRFDGGSQSQFHVIIFDKSATEIDYPMRKVSCAMKRKYDLKNKVVEEESEEDDISIEILDEFSPKLKQVKTTVSLDSSAIDDVECSSYKSKGNDKISVDMRQKKLKRKLDAFVSSYPHFKSIMYPSHVTYKYKLAVPSSHASIYFSSKCKEIILNGPNGKSYSVRVYVGKKITELLNGWKSFVLDNDLQVGDACIFELINKNSRSKNAYKVSIFRISS